MSTDGTTESTMKTNIARNTTSSTHTAAKKSFAVKTGVRAGGGVYEYCANTWTTVGGASI